MTWRETWHQFLNCTRCPGHRHTGDVRVPLVALRDFVSRPHLVLGIGLQYEIAHTLLCARISNRAQQREAATLTVDGVLARRKRDVAARTSALLPHGEADQLQAVEHAFGEV